MPIRALVHNKRSGKDVASGRVFPSFSFLLFPHILGCTVRLSVCSCRGDWLARTFVLLDSRGLPRNRCAYCEYEINADFLVRYA